MSDFMIAVVNSLREIVVNVVRVVLEIVMRD